jgi:hypothetical protein
VLADDVLRIGALLGLDADGLATVLRTSSSAGIASRTRIDVGSIAGLAATPAGPALSKDVGLLRRALSGHPREDVLEVADRFVTAMRNAHAAGQPPAVVGSARRSTADRS